MEMEREREREKLQRQKAEKGTVLERKERYKEKKE